MLPFNFSFIWKESVAGSGHPGEGGELRDALTSLKQKGIMAILSLTEEPLDMGAMRQHEFEYMHVPVNDFTAPTPSQIDEAIEFLTRQEAEGRGVLVHCRAGVGRTGTILACWLVAKGRDAQAAIEEVRRLRPGSVEVYVQEYAVHQYAQRVRQTGA